jgi:trans-aconitate methyltransferase
VRTVAEDAYDAELSRLLADVESVSFWFRARNRLVVSLIRRYFGEPASVLEVGCGNGFVLSAIREAFPSARLVGIDLIEEALAVARERVPEAEFRRVDVLETSFEGDFDLVCALDVLEHVEHDEEMLARMGDTLKPGGGLLVLVPQHPRLWSGADQLAHHRRRYTREELVCKMNGAGLQVHFVSSFVTSLLPAMALSRLLRRRSYRIHHLRDQLEPGWLNRPFERLLDIERWLIVSRGISLPAGGSLLVVATRSTSQRRTAPSSDSRPRSPCFDARTQRERDGRSGEGG